MKSLPTISPYDQETENNNAKAVNMMALIFPELKVPLEYVYQTMSFLQETNVNAEVLPRVIRGIHNLMLGTGEGEVIVHVRKETITLETKERDGEIKTKNI